jgi:antitoxin ParD1/3/4
MSAIERLTITLPAEMAATVRSAVAGGDYASTSEVIRAALRDWARNRNEEHRELAALRMAVRLGDESGPSISADEVFAELRQMIADRRAAAR